FHPKEDSMRFIQPRSCHSRNHRRRAFLEALESRRLLTTYTLLDQGSPTLNGTYFQNVLNGTVLPPGASVPVQLGDTLILPATSTYLKTGFTLPVLTGTGTLTIQSSALASLPAGVRVGPAQASLMPKLQTTGANTAVISTTINGSSVPSHDYTFLGI